MGNKYGRKKFRSQHKKYKIEQENNYRIQYNYTGKRYITTEGKYKRFDHKLNEEISKEFRMERDEDLERVDNRIAST